jgi:hypothetical protein
VRFTHRRICLLILIPLFYTDPMKSKHLLLGLSLALCGVMTASAATTRVWTDAQGRKVEATFIKLDGETITIQMANGTIYSLPVTKFSAEDQQIAKTLAPAENANALMSVPTNASAAQAASKIDQLVEQGIINANPKLAEAAKKEAAELAKVGKQAPAFVPLRPNPLMTDEQFVRRAYVDIAGRIPNYDETNEFLKGSATDKRAKLIDKLLDTDGYVSSTYNYLGEMLRVADKFEADFVRGLPYIQWLKEQVKVNRPWDQMVYDMLTADGKLWHNGATGYLLRDSGMPLDNLANTLTVFLGTDVACAQCHDHPFADWTQKQFYEMAAFFGATSTQMGRNDFTNGDPRKRLETETDYIMEKNGVDPKKYRNLIGNVLGANRYVVSDVAENRTKLPPDYQYSDAAPGSAVAPKLIMWSEDDKRNPAYAVIGDTVKKGKKDEGGVKNAEDLREAFAKWATHPSNPRFAMTVANRMWSRAFGVALTPTVRNIDNPDEAYNPELLKHLAAEMVRVKFNLKEFMRIVYNTKAYQREATTAELAMGMPYYFQGPVLRRMTAEQAWDSYMTLVLGDPDKAKSTEADLYGRSIDMNLNTVDAQTVLQKVNAIQTIAAKQREKMGGGLAMAGMTDDKMMEGGAATADDAAMMGSKILSYGNMKLMRASELEQPAPGGHFLREFGQSERILIDGGSREGSVPQVLMMMNGKAQEMLTNKDSLIFRNMEKVPSPADKVEAMFLSILSRRPTLQEKDIAKKELSSHGEDGYANMIWALINTREFSFIQ